MSSKQQGVARRLTRAFLLQALYISIAVVVGLTAVTLVVEDVLIKQALRGEADFYWERVEEKQDHTLPETRNMVSYRDGHGPVPSSLAELEAGFHRIEQPEQALALITEREGERLYQVFDTGRVGYLVTWFGLVPLGIVLAGVYMSLFQAYRVSSRAVSPIIELANRVKQLDPANPNVDLFAKNSGVLDVDDEIQTLNSAMQDLTQRLVEFVKREFDFTRDASHELRSPLTVVSIACQSLSSGQDLNDSQRKTLSRIQKATKDMEELTEAFLLLARESNQSLPADWINVNDVVSAEIDQAEILVGDKPVSISQESEAFMIVKAPEKVLSSVVGNLLRNGVNYTDEGSVVVTVSRDGVTIADSGAGMDEEELKQVFKAFNRGKRERQRGGFGVGLTIVKRLCERFDWPLSIESELGVGTTVKVGIPKAQRISD